MKNIHRIVITGGPCAGKTTAFARIQSELSLRGYKVYIVPETFTEMYGGGIKLLDYVNIDFQEMLLNQQIHKEEMYNVAAQKIENENVVILYDRGVMDALAYMSSEEAEELFKRCGYRQNELKMRYDAVIHMVTAADGAEEAFLKNRENNEARYENLTEAIVVDRKLVKVWTGHSHLRIIDNGTDFQEKITRVMNEIYSVLGEPIPLEIEKKYLIAMPDFESLGKSVVFSEHRMIQTYLTKKDANVERRIRQCGKQGDYIFYYTEKQYLTGISRIEKERMISEKEYLDLLTEADTQKRQILKNRFCFVWNNTYFELDVYSFWSEYAILEVEIMNENEEIELPPFITVLRDVTNDKKYKNYFLATEVPMISIETKK